MFPFDKGKNYSNTIFWTRFCPKNPGVSRLPVILLSLRETPKKGPDHPKTRKKFASKWGRLLPMLESGFPLLDEGIHAFGAVFGGKGRIKGPALEIDTFSKRAFKGAIHGFLSHHH